LAILPIDNGRYGTKEMMEIFGEQKKVDYQLEIEGAAAVSQSDIGIIPKGVGKKINKAANSGKITAKRIKQLEAKSDHDTAALV
jgi:adenylosuccinate lyase